MSAGEKRKVSSKSSEILFTTDAGNYSTVTEVLQGYSTTTIQHSWGVKFLRILCTRLHHPYGLERTGRSID